MGPLTVQKVRFLFVAELRLLRRVANDAHANALVVCDDIDTSEAFSFRSLTA